MDIRKFTQRSVEAIQGAQSIAIEHNNQQVDEEHLLLALLTQEDSLIASLLTRMGKDADAFTEAVRGAVERRPQVWPSIMATMSSTFWPATSLEMAFKLPSQPPVNWTLRMMPVASSKLISMAREQTPRVS